MSMLLEINGTPYEFFKNFNVKRNIENFSGEVNIVATESDLSRYPIKVNDKCVVLINGYPVLTGYIESISPSTSPYDHNISINGRDVTCDIIDSTLLGSDIEMKPKFSLTDLINKVQGALGLKLPIKIDAPITLFDETDYVAASDGKNAWDFIDEHARKKQVLVNTDGNGGIVCMRADSAQDYGLVLINKRGAISNVLRSSSSFDFTNRFGSYICSSQANLTLSSDGKSDNDSMVTIRSSVIGDKGVRSSRKFVFVAEQASSVEDATNRAKWQANLDRARSITYSATIQGHVYEQGVMVGQPYNFNHLVAVIDENCDIDAIMLIKSVTFSLSLDGGSITELEIVDKDSYTLELTDPSLRDRKTDKVGNNFYGAPPTDEEIEASANESDDEE